MKFKALKNFSSIRWGNVSAGDYIELNKDTASQMIKNGMVEMPEEMARKYRTERKAVKAK